MAKKIGRPRALTDEQAAEVRQRFGMYVDARRRHSAAALAAEFDVSVDVILTTVHRRHKETRSTKREWTLKALRERNGDLRSSMT